jgi:dihydrofolate reductase
VKQRYGIKEVNGTIQPMRKIVYYVATSVDGFICGPDEDVSGFLQEGNAIDKYLNDLKEFDTVIMGRKTYEDGYKYGLEPGQPAYSHMEHYIFSRSLVFQNKSDRVHVCEPDIGIIEDLKKGEGTDIYLCGGGLFAGWLLDYGMVDILKIKLNPLILGDGVPLFGDSRTQYKLNFIKRESFQYGLQMLTYRIVY